MDSLGLLDFHTHSIHSDGSDTPTELVKRAKEAGVSVIALTDHQSISGLYEFRRACKKANILGIPFGTEICAELPAEILTVQDNDAPDLIILGKNPKPEPMQEYRNRFFKDVRQRWLPETIRRLEKIGFKMPAYDLDEQCKPLQVPPRILYDFMKHGDNIEVLVKHATAINPKLTPEEVRQNPHRWLNRTVYLIGGPGYVKRVEGFNVDDAKKLADAMNCMLFIAHPGGEYGFLSDKTLEYYIQKKVRGIEIRSYFNTPEQNTKFDRLAEENKLVRSGGSDCHGKNGPFKIGMYDKPQNQVPKQVLEELWNNLPN